MTDQTDKPEGMIGGSIHLFVYPSDIARNLFLYVQKVGYLEMRASCSVSSESMDSFLLLDVVYGTGALIYENNEYPLEKGDLLFLDCKKEHTYYTTDEMGIIYLYFNGKQANEYYDMISKPILQIFKIENFKTMMSLFWQIIVLHKKNNRYAEHLTSLHITRILTEISMLCDNEPVSDVEYPEYINDIFHQIDHFYNQKFTLDLLAERYSVNKFHLTREFKRCAGTTFRDYLLTTRINKAKELLRSSNMSMEQIAESVGFYNSSHMIKVFHDREHVTPLYYRKQWTR